MNSIIDAKPKSLRKLLAELTKQDIKLHIEDFTLENSNYKSGTKLYVKNKMYIPNDKSLKLFLLKQHHNPPT